MYTKEMRNKELNNGRMAMFAAVGIVAADLATGKDGMQQLGLFAVRDRASRIVCRAEAEAAPVFSPSKEVGAMAPLGFFDPLGFAKEGDEAGFRNLRAAEIKHGRVAMMAALGAVVQHYVKLPGFDGVPAGLAAVTAAPGTYGFAALFLVAGALELGVWTEDSSKEPGNFGDPLSLGQYNEEMRNKELNNGRMAMFAALGIVAADLATGKDGMQQLGLFAVRDRASRIVCRAEAEAAPVFSPAKQVGAMAPLGFFDPLGFSKEGDEAGFRNLRAAEIKHGRVAMAASVGYLITAAGYHFPGAISLDGTTFESIGTSWDKVPDAGKWQIIGVVGLLELLQESMIKPHYMKGGEPGNVPLLYDPLGFSKKLTAEQKKSKLQSELKNGRLAMIGIMSFIAAHNIPGSVPGIPTFP